MDRNGSNVDFGYFVDADRRRRRDIGDTGGKICEPAAIKAPAAIRSEVPGNSRLTKANDSPNAVTNMTATAQLECAEMKSRVG